MIYKKIDTLLLLFIYMSNCFAAEEKPGQLNELEKKDSKLMLELIQAQKHLAQHRYQHESKQITPWAAITLVSVFCGTITTLILAGICACKINTYNLGYNQAIQDVLKSHLACLIYYAGRQAGYRLGSNNAPTTMLRAITAIPYSPISI